MSNKSKVLVLGGSSFIGRNLVEALVKRDDLELTLFNRGLTNPDIFDNVSKITGDRSTADIEQVFGHDWDYVVDLSCYFPHDLRSVLEGLSPSVQGYIFISTCSVYDNAAYQGQLRDEQAPILACSPEQELDTSMDSYGQRKAACERLLTVSQVPHSILRPALVYGRYDPTDRFYYWLHQVMRYDDILMPEDGLRKFSLTYVGDLVATISRLVTGDTTSGTYNITSTPQASIHAICSAITAAAGVSPRYRSASPGFLISHDIAQWSGIPVWLHSDDYTYSNDLAQQHAALVPTDLPASIDTVLAYYRAQDMPTPISGITREEQLALIQQLEI